MLADLSDFLYDGIIAFTDCITVHAIMRRRLIETAEYEHIGEFLAGVERKIKNT